MMRSFSAVAAIVHKREGGEHPPEEIEAFIAGLMDGTVTDYQMTAWMMAILFQGMTRMETARLTRAMIESGKTLSPWGDGPPVVDKHSTGGIGDKVSLVIAPLAAACGLRVPMISGRSLGHTGGTLDKLESIPGYRVHLTPQEFHSTVQKIGVSIAGANDALVPADRRMYALRDVSGIIESPPLIVSSILSKKAAAQLDGLVLDVKVGAGGFMPEREKADLVAQLLCDAGSELGMRVEVLLTWMGDPLGHTVGNSLEVIESIEFLQGKPPSEDFGEICIETVAAMLRVGGEDDEEAIRSKIDSALSSGRGLQRLAEMITAHGGNPRVTEEISLLPRAPVLQEVKATEDGWVLGIEARPIGELILDLGGGRRRAEDRIDHRVGIDFRVSPGDRVARGETIALLHLGEHASPDDYERRLRASIHFGDAPPTKRATILGRLRASGGSTNRGP